MAAFSTSSSASLSFSVISTSAFLASTRAANSLRKVLKGLIFFWASVSFCCNAEYSARAFFRVSAAYFRALVSLRLICFRASAILSCPSFADTSISSIAAFKMSPSSSGGSAINGAAMSATDSTESSAAATSSIIAGSVSCSSCVSFSSAFFCASCDSACLFALCMPCWAFWRNPFTLLSSAVRFAWTPLTLGESLDSSVTDPTAAAPPFLASLMSAVRDLCISSSDVCCC
mmetsp:Transcript_112055/g.327734  ORF Transcript_112055/g.327734 Transcript_112055/m.327734 type:complete len:231 (-) Transcript_112055:936-1628(-)